MAYLHISNLYKSQEILLFKECYALEKIHGTSAHVSWNEGKLGFFSGGEKHEPFVALFDQNNLKKVFTELGIDKLMVYGEAYGGKQQGMRDTYGSALKFVAFDVTIYNRWISVPDAEEIVKKLGLEFVDYIKIPTTLEAIDAQRDRDSVQAIRNGMGDGKKREGVVLRPLVEMIKCNGERIITKHKRDEFRETKTARRFDKLQEWQLENNMKAESVADEWVTPMRLSHVLDKVINPNINQTGLIIRAMVEDVLREGGEEVENTGFIRKAIGKKTVLLFKKYLRNKMEESCQT